MSADSDFAERWNIKNELSRKTYEAIEWLANGLNKGKFTEGQFTTAVDAVFMTVAGLVNYPIMEIVAAASQSCERLDANEKRHFVKANHSISFTWIADSDSCRAVGRKDGVISTDKRMEYETPELARAAMNKAADKLLTIGYTEL